MTMLPATVSFADSDVLDCFLAALSADHVATRMLLFAFGTGKEHLLFLRLILVAEILVALAAVAPVIFTVTIIAMWCVLQLQHGSTVSADGTLLAEEEIACGLAGDEAPLANSKCIAIHTVELRAPWLDYVTIRSDSALVAVLVPYEEAALLASESEFFPLLHLFLLLRGSRRLYHDCDALRFTIISKNI